MDDEELEINAAFKNFPELVLTIESLFGADK